MNMTRPFDLTIFCIFTSIKKTKLPDFWEKLGRFLFVIKQISHSNRFEYSKERIERI